MKLTLYSKSDIDAFLSLMRWREEQRLEELRRVLVRARLKLQAAMQRAEGVKR